MKLTEIERQELNGLIHLQSSRTIPMMQNEFERLQYLLNKSNHNYCSNPSCEGYEGEEDETTCHVCGARLFKLINVREEKIKTECNELSDKTELQKLNLPHVIKAVCDECDGSGWWKENEIDKVIVCPKCKGKQTDL